MMCLVLQAVWKEITTKKVLGIPGHVAYAIVLVQMEGVYHY